MFANYITADNYNRIFVDPVDDNAGRVEPLPPPEPHSGQPVTWLATDDTDSEDEDADDRRFAPRFGPVPLSCGVPPAAGKQLLLVDYELVNKIGRDTDVCSDY